MYGTRAAADGWQQEYSGFRRSIGFTEGEASTCIFVHESRGIACTVHGDDFTSTGPKAGLDGLEAQLKGKYDLREGGRLGPGPDDAKELTVLKRVLRYTPDGFEYEADPRQAEKLLEGFNLDIDCNGAATPGLQPLIEQFTKDEQLPADGHTGFRGLAAKANLPFSRSYRFAILRQRDVSVCEQSDRHGDRCSQAYGPTPACAQTSRV